MLNKQWYAVRYRPIGYNIWNYDSKSAGSIKLWTLGHAKRRQLLYTNFESEVLIIDLIKKVY